MARLGYLFFGVLTSFFVSFLLWSSLFTTGLESNLHGYVISTSNATVKSNYSFGNFNSGALSDTCTIYKEANNLKEKGEEANDRMMDKNKASNNTNYNNKIYSGKVEKGVWFYANSFENSIPLEIVDQLLTLNVNTIYFGGTTIPDWKDPKKSQMYSNFICYAYSKGLSVYAVTLEDPLFAFGKEKQIQEEFRDFILSTKDLFDTYMIDVEPHTLHISDPLVYIPQYIRMSLALQEISNKYNVTYVDTVPYWYHFVIKNIGISPGLNILGGDRVNLMDYTYTANQSINNIKAVLPEVQKPFTISIKATPGLGDPFLNSEQLKSTIENFENNSIPIGLFELQYLLRNLP